MNTGNPIRDAQRHYEDQEEERRYVECCECGCPLEEGETAWNILDDWYCPECAYKLFVTEVTA